MSTTEKFAKVYDLSVQRNQRRVPIIEHYLQIAEPFAVSLDDERSEPALYRDIAEDGAGPLVDCLQWLLGELRTTTYERAGGILDGLDYLQSVVADVLWRYGADVEESLESFAREFDRLDLPDERRRLYEMAQDTAKSPIRY